VVEGRFNPEKGLLYGTDGRVYKAHQITSHKRWTTRHPEDVFDCLLHRAWPHSTPEGIELTLIDSLHPTDPRCEALESQIWRCSISGEITNQKTAKGIFVMRVKRNIPAPKGQHRSPAFIPRLLFIRGRLTPLSDYLNHIVRLDCRLEGGFLVLDSVASIGESLEEVLELGGTCWPWPFLSNASSIKRLCDLNPDPDRLVLARSDCREVLQRQLDHLQSLSKQWINDAAENRRLARDADRLRIIAKRIGSICKPIADDDLRGMLRRTNLLSVLCSVQNDLTAASKMTVAAPDKPKAEPKAKPKAKAKAIDLPATLEPMAELLLSGHFDDLICMKLDITPKLLKGLIGQLVACGWFDTLTDEQRAQLQSYQLKKAIRLRG